MILSWVTRSHTLSLKSLYAHELNFSPQSTQSRNTTFIMGDSALVPSYPIILDRENDLEVWLNLQIRINGVDSLAYWCNCEYCLRHPTNSIPQIDEMLQLPCGHSFRRVRELEILPLLVVSNLEREQARSPTCLKITKTQNADCRLFDRTVSQDR